jgi:putative tryptophan/tyrosine transport system substrate-binding protein
MRRRDFIKAIACSAAAWPLAARAQKPAMPVVGYLGFGSPKGFATRLAAFRQGLQEAGYREGQNVAIEYRWADGQNERLPALAADLVRHQVTVIFTPSSTNAARAAKSATTTIPIVFETGVDPVTAGLVTSLSRPNGNVTGVTSLNVGVGQKRLEVLRELLPTAMVVAALINPINVTAETATRDLQAAARSLGLQLHILHASSEGDFDVAFATLAQLRADGLVVSQDPFFIGRSEQLVDLTLRRRVATMFSSRDFVVAGGLMSYGGSVAESHRQTGIYVGRILNGEKPADLPVMQPTKFELVINLQTARALGLTVPQTLLVAADEVIE